MKKYILSAALCVCVMFIGMMQIASASSSPSGIVLDTHSETVTGVSNLMEYSTNGTRWTAITKNPLNIASLIPAATARNDVTLSIRLKATSGAAASQPTNIILPRRPATPVAASVKFDGFTESIAAADSMEFRTGTSGVFTAVPAGGRIPVNVGTSSQRVQVRLKATDTTFASAVRSVTVPSRKAAPNAIYNGSTDRITGVSKAMEYSLNSGAAWTDVTASNLPRSLFGDAAATVMIRTRATATAPSSNIRNVAVPNAATTSPDGIALDTRTETVTGVSNLMEYSTNGTKWTAITKNPLNIANLIPAATARADVTLSIRLKATSGAAASLPTNITLPRRPTTPVAASVKFDGFTESIAAAASMEFRIGTSGDFAAVPADGRIPINIGTSSQSYRIRFMATDTTFASATRTVTVPSRKAAPNAVYNGSTDRITGVSTAMEYSLDNGAAWTNVTASFLQRSLFGDAAATVMIRTKATASAPSSNIRNVAIPDAATTSPTEVSLDTQSETITGVSNLMEYSTNGTKWTAITKNPLNIASMIPAATANSDVTISIRLKAANGAAASLPTNITLPPRPAAPAAASVKFDGLAESITAIDSMEFRVGTTGEFTSVPVGETNIPVNIGTSSQSYQFRIGATDTTFVSATFAVSVPARAAAPNAAYNGYMITGVSNTMDFSLDEGETWTPVSGSSITRSEFGNTAVTVMVRVRATASAPSSQIRNVDVPNAGAAAPDGFDLDMHNETVTGVSDLMEFSTSGITWTAITENPLNIASLVSAANDVTLRIRYMAANDDPASLAAYIVLPHRPAAPATSDVRFDGLTESIKLTDSMEFRAGTTGDFKSVPVGETAIPVNIGISSQNYQVRSKATDTMFASATRAVTVPVRAAAPNAMYNSTTDIITAVSTAMEFSLDGGESWTTVSGLSIPRSVFGESAATVMIRTKATSSAPSSNIRNVAVPREDDVFPTGLALDTRSETVTGVSNLMEYSTNGTTWTAITQNTLNIANMIPAATASNDVILSIRYKAANGEPASFAVSMLLTRRPDAPTATAVKFDGLTESITATALMEFRASATGTFTSVSAGTTRIPVNAGTSSQNYQVRVKATDTKFASATRTVTVPARAAAPNAAYNSSTGRIIGVSTNMEYSIDGGTSWKPVITSFISRIELGNAAVTAMVRIKATSTAPSSSIRNVAVPQA